MSGVELSVAAIAAVIGYLVISALWPTKKNDRASAQSSSNESRVAHDKSRPEEPWHVTLGVRPSASIDEIKWAYRQQIAKYHPDKVAQLGPELQRVATQMSTRINAAYEEGCRVRGA